MPGPRGGEGNNWEGSGPGGGSTMAPGTVNTQTGNRLTTMPITGWKTKGGMAFGLTLYHNAQDNVDVGWGQNWRSNWDFRVLYTGYTVNGNRDYLTVVYPTGKRVAFTREQTNTANGPIWGSAFYPPVGYHDMVYATQFGYSLRTSDQHVYVFNPGGALTSMRDRYGNTVTATFSNGTLTKIADASGRSISMGVGPVPGGRYGIVSVVNDQSHQQWQLAQYPQGQGGGVSGGGPKYLSAVYLPPLAGYTYYHTFGYTASGAISHEGTPDNKGYAFAYDDNLRLTRFTDPLGHATTYTYNGGNTVRTKPDGGKQTDFYDSGVLHSEQDEAGFSKTFLYDADYNVVQITDERGNVSHYGYDAYGNRTSGQDPRQSAAGVSTATTYNVTNDVLSQSDARGATTTLSRDANGTVLSATDALGNVLATNTWDPTGVLTGTSAAGASTTATYDSYGNPQTVTSPKGGVTLAYTDSRFPDRPTSSTDDDGRETDLTYDEWGRVAQVDRRADGASMQLQYDLMGRATQVTDWLGHVTTYGYDDAGRRTSKTNARGDTETYAYDACNRVTSITDGRGKARTYRYTYRGEVAQLSLADGSTESYRYDGAGNQTSRTNGMYQKTTYAYDASNDLASIAYPSGTGVTYSYDLDGRKASMTDATGTSTWTYDLADRTTSLATPQGTQSYSYDQWGRRTLLDLGNGSTIRTVYSDEKLASVTKMPENETTRWNYGADDVPTSQVLPSGATTRYGYDALDRVSAITHQAPGGGTISAETYAYDAGGNLTFKVVDGARTDYSYDAIDQLLSEAGPYGTTAYTYDGNGNRLTRVANGQTETYAYDDGDKLTSRSGGPQGTVTYGYDGCGRTRTVQAGAGTTTLTYDDEDQLTQITGPGGLSETYAYNGADARVSKAGTGGSRTYRRDGVGSPTRS